MNHHDQVQSLCLQAIDVFNKLYSGAVIKGGPIFTTGASSFAIDCSKTQHRLLVTTLNSDLEQCAIAMIDLTDSNDDADIPHDLVAIAQLSTEDLVKYMETKFGT